ncbi:fungal-specific transcription factor domain-containing protein [Coniochaeta sp. 2T2.1]|nr:fungal-specific transcription factor domain-containing protein [Coniochaeta sp. 2T2.1]
MTDEQTSPVEARRRSRRTRPSGRRFECTYHGCGKYYSRAEHLERHQLNHVPKQLFVCPVEGCTLSFVRKDLFLRHRSRHEQQPQGGSTSENCGTPGLTPGQEFSTSIGTEVAFHTQSPQQDAIATRTVPDLRDLRLSSLRPNYSEQAVPLAHVAGSPDCNELSGIHAGTAPLQGQLPISPNMPALGTVPLGAQNGLPSIDLNELESPANSSLDEFAAWLFEGYSGVHDLLNPLDFGFDTENRLNDAQMTEFNTGLDFNTASSRRATYAHQSSEVTELRGTALPTEKWEHLASLITGKLLDAAVDHSRFLTDICSETDPLSISSMQLYLEAYWKHFHECFPILHYPTFSPDATHTYLLMAVLIIGSSMLKRQKGHADKGMDHTDTMAWNLRGHVLLHADASSPARLWVFQTLLLLEFHDKLLTSASLHDRALVFFPTTLNLMRQSSTLFGRQVPRSPNPSSTGTSEASITKPELSVGFFAPAKPASLQPGSWWEYWIVQESIRRAAFAAFVLDITHSVMFGHSQTLVFHEIHLFLPCDRLLWFSHSPNEVGAVESSLYANGVRPLSFLEALRAMFKRQPHRTNMFGWLVLLSGLFSIIGHMQQRDRLTSSLDNDLVSTPSDKWQPRLIKALQWWKSEYDSNIEHLRGANLDWRKLCLSEENRNGMGDDLALNLVLYHIGHINIYISIPELSVVAGATKILGRLVSPFEKRMMKEKIARWAASPGAIHALYHALELIRLILFPVSDRQRSSYAPIYDAAFDKLPNRSWALYFATMVIWAYGFQKDGRLKPFPTQLSYPPTSPTSTGPYDPVRCQDQGTDTVSAQQRLAREEDARMYLDQLSPSSIKSPQEFARHIQHVKSGRNRVLGLLSVVDQAISGSSWELLDEARKRLKTAAVILKDGSQT